MKFEQRFTFLTRLSCIYRDQKSPKCKSLPQNGIIAPSFRHNSSVCYIISYFVDLCNSINVFLRNFRSFCLLYFNNPFRCHFTNPVANSRAGVTDWRIRCVLRKTVLAPWTVSASRALYRHGNFVNLFIDTFPAFIKRNIQDIL